MMQRKIQLNPALKNSPFNECEFIVPSTCFFFFDFLRILLLAVTEFHLLEMR